MCQRSWNFVINHGILPILPPNCRKYVNFFATTEKLSICVESLHFPVFSAKSSECKIKKIDGHGKSHVKNNLSSLWEP